MPNTPPSVRAARVKQVEESLQRDNVSFEKTASRATLAKTRYAKSFLEDYYKNLAENTPSSPTPPSPRAQQDNGAEMEKKRTRSKSLKKMFTLQYRKIKGGSRDTIEITDPTSFSHKSHVGFSQNGLEAQNLPEELQAFVEKLNGSLTKLGADSISQSELKLLLATPEFSQQQPQEQIQTQPDVEVKPKRKLSSSLGKKMGLSSSPSPSDKIEVGAPQNFVKVSGFTFGEDANPATLRMKLELAEKTLREESQQREQAETRASDLSFSLSRLQYEVEQLRSVSVVLQKDSNALAELRKLNRQQEAEIAMWKKRLSYISQRDEEALDAEVKKRKVLEQQYSEVVQQKTESDSKEIVRRAEETVAQLRSELSQSSSQYNREKMVMREENDALKRELEMLRSESAKEKRESEDTKTKLAKDLEAVRLESLKKVEEATRRLEIERKQRRVDQMTIETVSRTNAEYLARLSSTEPSSPSVIAPALPVDTAAPPPPPPMPERSLSETVRPRSASLDQQLSAVKLTPVRERKETSKRVSPQQSSMDLLAYAIIARRQAMEVDEVEEDDSSNFSD